MLKVAMMTDGPSLDSIISSCFHEGRYLLIVDAESAALLDAVSRAGQSDIQLARRIVQEDCEALISGPIEEAPFVIIADEGCCTRYDGSLLPALLAQDKMNDYALPLLTDYIGGTGCHPGEESGCRHHHE